MLAYGVGVEDTYPTPRDKIELVAVATRVAKETMVAEDGIGEDVPFSLMVWRDEHLTAICQLDAGLRDELSGERLFRTVEAAAACRRGFDATAFTFVTEGYCAMDPLLIDPDVPLAAQFVENTDVKECLTVTHIEAGNVYLSALPYKYEVGRKMNWDAPVHYDPVHSGSNLFLSSMVEVLLVDVAEPLMGDPGTWGELVADEVARWGFHIQWGLDGELGRPDL
jgi:hypothetical protein